MDSFFGIGLPELLVILLLAGLVLGPSRIRQVAHTLGSFVAQVRMVSHQFKQRLNAELDGLDQTDFREALDEVRQLQRQVSDLSRQITSVPADLANEGRQVMSGEQPEQRNGQPAGDSSLDSASPTPSLPRLIEVPGDPE